MNAAEAVIYITHIHGRDSLGPQGRLSSSAHSLMALEAFRLHLTDVHNPGSGLQAIRNMWSLSVQSPVFCLVAAPGGPKTDFQMGTPGTRLAFCVVPSTFDEGDLG